MPDVKGITFKAHLHHLIPLAIQGVVWMRDVVGRTDLNMGAIWDQVNQGFTPSLPPLDALKAFRSTQITGMLVLKVAMGAIALEGIARALFDRQADPVTSLKMATIALIGATTPLGGVVAPIALGYFAGAHKREVKDWMVFTPVRALQLHKHSRTLYRQQREHPGFSALLIGMVALTSAQMRHGLAITGALTGILAMGVGQS